ncbi:hypothetical protein [Micromonospora sp. NPDC023644]|uniref:hypothetical protein n=1 Tax=Micromonospora sp. NPDC023644 TaxID=3154321 RepID=UPI0034032458
MDTVMWYPLRPGGDGGDLVLAVDFGGAREEAGFEDLAAWLPSDCAVWVTQPPDHVVDGPAEAARHIDTWRDLALSAGARISAVIGYCSGAATAAHLAREFAAHRQPVGLVLVDPAWATRELLVDVYRSSVEALGRACDLPPERDGRGDGPAPDGAGLVHLARQLADRYAGVAGDVGRELDIEDDLVEDLVVRMRRYLSYLVVTGLARPPAQLPVPALTVMSAAHPEESFPQVGDRRVRFDVARADLLADPRVGQLLTEFVAGRATSSR